jgi:hypothetical protein
MTIGRFRGWFTRAYPSVKFYEQSQSLVYLSDNKRDIQCIINGGTDFSFPSLMPEHAYVNDDYHVVLYCMILWGTPRLEYRFLTDPGAPIRIPKILKESSKAQKQKSQVTPKSTMKISGTKNDVFRELESYARHDIEAIPIPGGSVEVVIDGHHGPVLYDYGLTPGVTKGHLFAPYSHQADVQKILRDFKNSLR